MGIAVGQPAPSLELATERPPADGRVRVGLRYLAHNRQLTLGIVLLGLLIVFVILGNLLYDVGRHRPLSVLPGRPPSAEFPLGTDSQGRDILAVMIAGTPLTLRMGILAGFLGVAIGTVLAFAGAYYGGLLDSLVRGVVDVGLTIPPFLVLIIVAITIHSAMTIEQIAPGFFAPASLLPTPAIPPQAPSMPP